MEHSPDAPFSPTCDPNCSCVCHLEYPGMKLVWVPVDVEDGEDDDDIYEFEVDWEEEEEERVGEGESKAEDEAERSVTSFGEDGEASIVKQQKANIHHVLDVVLAENQRRLSDPGPHALITSLSPGRCHSPPIPPKRAQSQSPPTHPIPPLNEDEDIYELTLPAINPTPKNTMAPSRPLCQELDIPLIRVRKPVRRAKMSSSTSDPTSEFQTDPDPISCVDDVPPAIPPRMPMAQDSSKNTRNLAPVHRGGIPLPQPTAEEWRSLRPSSPNSSNTSTLTPVRAAPPPPVSPHLPHRAPLSPPKTEPRRPRAASMQSLVEFKGWY